MAITTRSDGRVTRLRRQAPDLGAHSDPPPEGQNDPPLPPLVSPPSDVEQSQMVVLEAHIAFLTRKNAELLLRILERSHSEINRVEQEKEHNNQANSRVHHKDYFYKEDCREGEPSETYHDGINPRRDLGGDVEYLDRNATNLERK
jgi:hypothetical protein